MLEVCPSIADGRPSLRDPPAVDRRRGDPVRLVFDARVPALAVARAHRPGRPLPARRQTSRRGRAGRAAAEAPGRAGGLAAAAGPPDGGRGLAHRRRLPPHRAQRAARHRDSSQTSPRWPASSSCRSTRRPRMRVHARAALEPGLLSPRSRPLGATTGAPRRASSGRRTRRIVEAGLVTLTFGNASAASTARPASWPSSRAASPYADAPAGGPGRRRPRDRCGRGRDAPAVLRHADAPRPLPAFPEVGGVVHTHSTVRGRLGPGPREPSRASARPTPTTSTARFR